MNSSTAGKSSHSRFPGRGLFNAQSLPFWATVIVFLILYVLACAYFRNFAQLRVFLHFINDGAFLGLTAIGMTFVILSGGIDLSVGSMIGFSSILIATLVTDHKMNAMLVIPMVMALGLLCGLAQGALIQVFGLQPFLVTLAGLFFFRGAALQISEKSIDLTDNVYRKLSDFSLDIGRAHLSFSGAVFLLVLILAIYIARFRPFGRYIYAIGGNEQSASLMGLPVNRTKIWIYGLSGLYAAFAGVLYTVDLSAGNAIAATGLELDAIAAVVVGGTLLSGGVGFIAGTFIGILIFGVIQTGISFQGNIPSAMTKVVIGGLLLAFVLLQKLIQRKVP